MKKKKHELEELRRPNEVEQMLFDVVKHLHTLRPPIETHVNAVESCMHARCAEARRVLNINGHLHRFDDPFLDPARVDKAADAVRAENKRKREAAHLTMHSTERL